jgi:hypothetical protein
VVPTIRGGVPRVVPNVRDQGPGVEAGRGEPVGGWALVIFTGGKFSG